MAELSITTGLKAISERLGEAVAIARASITCAESGSERQSLRIAMVLDELLHESVNLHGAVRLIGRMDRAATE